MCVRELHTVWFVCLFEIGQYEKNDNIFPLIDKTTSPKVTVQFMHLKCTTHFRLERLKQAPTKLNSLVRSRTHTNKPLSHLSECRVFFFCFSHGWRLVSGYSRSLFFSLNINTHTCKVNERVLLDACDCVQTKKQNEWTKNKTMNTSARKKLLLLFNFQYTMNLKWDEEAAAETTALQIEKEVEDIWCT